MQYNSNMKVVLLSAKRSELFIQASPSKWTMQHITYIHPCISTWKCPVKHDKGLFWWIPSTCQQAVKHFCLTEQTLHWFLTWSDWVHVTKFLRKSPFSQPRKCYSNLLQQSSQLKGQTIKNTCIIAYWHDPLNAREPQESVAMHQGCYLRNMPPCSRNMCNAAGCSWEAPAMSGFIPCTEEKGILKNPHLISFIA